VFAVRVSRGVEGETMGNKQKQKPKQESEPMAPAPAPEEVITDPAEIEESLRDTVDAVGLSPGDDESGDGSLEDAPAPAAGDAQYQSADAPIGRLVAGSPSTVDLEDALASFGLEPEHVLGWSGGPEIGLVIVTAGGRKLRWPQDEGRILTPAEKDGIRRDSPQYPNGYLNRQGAAAGR
jgi:hypothetical protein